MKINHIIQQSKRAVKNFSLFTLLFSFAIASCNREELAPQGESDLTATFKVEAPALTRATEVTGLTRYIVEAYEGKDLSSTPLRAEAETGALTLGLKKNTEYTFLFWADKGTAKTETVAGTGYWDVTTLQTVKIAAGKENTGGEAAYCFFKELNSKELTPNYAIMLKNATAQVNFIETEGLATAENKLVVTYAKGATLNVATGKVTDVASEMIHTFTGIAQTAKDGTLVADYVLAPLGEKNVMNLKMQFNTETEKAITAVPLQQSYKTNIKGEYSNFYASVFTVSNTVDDYTNNPDVEFPEPVVGYAIGDFYMKDGSIVSKDASLTAEQQANCIGIVYWLGDPTANDAALKAAHPGCTNGLVVSLKEDGTSAWQSTYQAYGTTVNEWTIANTNYAPIISGGELTNPINKIMGYNNTKAIQAFNAAPANSAYKVEAIEKVAAYQTSVPTPANNSGWFLPSMKELTLLCGLDNQDANVFDDGYGTGNRDAINAQLAKIDGATQIAKTYYWSSTEYGDGLAWVVIFLAGTSTGYAKNGSSSSVRVVSAF